MSFDALDTPIKSSSMHLSASSEGCIQICAAGYYFSLSTKPARRGAGAELVVSAQPSLVSQTGSQGFSLSYSADSKDPVSLLVSDLPQATGARQRMFDHISATAYQALGEYQLASHALSFWGVERNPLSDLAEEQDRALRMDTVLPAQLDHCQWPERGAGGFDQLIGVIQACVWELGVERIDEVLDFVGLMNLGAANEALNFGLGKSLSADF